MDLHGRSDVVKALAGCDWASTPLGPESAWPQSLRTAVSICRDSRFPIIIFWGPDLVQLYNEAYAPLIGAKHPNALGQRAEDCFPEIWSSIGPMLRGVLNTGVATWSEDMMLPLVRDGKPGEYYFTFSYSPIRDESGIGGVFCAVTETTERVLRSREADQLARELLELNRSKSALLSNVSHEFRTPLSLLLGTLEEALAQTADPRARESLVSCSRNALRLLKLVNSLLAFSRIEAGKAEGRFGPTPLSRVTADLVALFESSATRAGLGLTYDAQTNAIAYVDRDMWERVVTNLLSNALKYTLSGGIDVRTSSNEQNFELVVADTGIGIPAGELTRIFDRFHRVARDDGRSIEGVGIGLALTKELVQLHGGTLSVESELEHGSTFTVRIPLGHRHLPAEQLLAGTENEAQTAAAEFLADVQGWLKDPSTDVSASTPHGQHVLVVDDNADLRAYVARLLGDTYRISMASNGREALAIIHRDRPDLVVSDIAMPHVDGIELLQHIRDLPSSYDISVILLTARVGAEEIASALEVGADDYVTKPFTGAELLARVRTQIRAQQARRAAERQSQQNVVAFRALADALPGMVWTATLEGRRDFNNAAWRTYTGASEFDQWTAFVHTADRQGWNEAWALALHGPHFFRHDYRLWHAQTKRYHWATAQAHIVQLGSEILWVGTTIDIDERKRREIANAFLAKAGGVLGQSLDRTETFATLAGIATEAFCDHCVFYMVEDDQIQRASWHHRDPDLAPLLEELVRLGPRPDDSGWIIGNVIRTGERRAWAGENPDLTPNASKEYADALRRMDVRSMLVCPVRAGNRVYGAFAFCRIGASAAEYDQLDAETLMQFADRVALFVANSDLYEREHRVALSFQNAALPGTLATRTGVDLDAHYVAGSSEARIGGDWYDTELLGDGRVLLSVGDVSGSGLDAAVVMSMIRNAIRSVGHVYADPATMIAAADRAVRGRIGEHFATAFVGILDPVLSRITYSNAGHLPPIVSHNGKTYELPGGETPLGIAFDVDRQTRTAQLPNECVIVCFTDGLTEGAGGFLPGESALHECLRSNAFQEHGNARWLYKQLLPNGSRDDVAVLVARLSATKLAASTKRLDLHVANAADASIARDRICNELTEYGLRAGSAFEDARVIVGEITANVARHAPGDLVVAIDSIRQSLVVHFVDRGPGFRFSDRLPVNRLPSNVFAEGGRGLYIASALSRHLEAVPDLDGGSHICVVIAAT